MSSREMLCTSSLVMVPRLFSAMKSRRLDEVKPNVESWANSVSPAGMGRPETLAQWMSPAVKRPASKKQGIRSTPSNPAPVTRPRFVPHWRGGGEDFLGGRTAGVGVVGGHRSSSGWVTTVTRFAVTNSCTGSGKSRVTSQQEIVRLIHCQQVRHSIVLSPNGPAASSRRGPVAGSSFPVVKATGRARCSGMASRHRGGRIVIAPEVDAGVFPEFVEAVVGLDDADGA